ncbi:MAG: glycosyltransferase family 9 protein [Nitrospirae bacterium]|nr:MAG: glycosyltransferase family 9 protein [Nitrospirota bacterium]
MNILLVRPDGIGDEILCLPVATALRRLLPDAKVSFLSSVYAAPVLAQHPDLAAILTLNGRERFADLVALFRRGFDAAIFLKPFRRLMAAAFVARVPVRVATGYRWYSLLANRRVYEHRSDFSRHEATYNLGLLRGLGLEPGELIRPQLFLTDDERQEAAAKLKAIPSPCIVVHPGGFSSRQWKLQHYLDLTQRLVKEGYGVVLSGSQTERDRFREETGWRGSAHGSILDVMGTVTLRQLMAIIGASQSLVSGSTGPAHIAAGLGVPTVSLFDPRRNQLPTRWQPLGQGMVLRPDVPTCEKCIYEACPYWDCLDRISVEQVCARIRQVVTKPEAMAVAHV